MTNNQPPVMPEASLGCLAAVGTAWRSDWSDFDGRTLQDQLSEIAGLIRREVAGEDVRQAAADFLTYLT